MWLRDALPHDLPGARVLTYGYDTRLAESNSFQNLEDVALTFRASLRVALGSRPPDRPLIFIAHSLGGLVLKQAMIQMASGDSIDRRTFQSTYGILFFGVPNQGMDISSLLAMVGSQPNLPFLTMLSKDSGSLQGLVERFRKVFDFQDSEIISLYETYASRTATKDTLGKWTMSGDYAILVDRFSARSGRQWEESHPFLHPINGNHSDMVKFSEYDDVGAIVVSFLIGFARTAPAVIKDRIERLESSASGPSDSRQITFRSQLLRGDAETEELEKPIEAKHRNVKFREGTELSSKGKEGLNDGHQEGWIEVEPKKSKRSSSSGTSIRKPDTDLEMFANAGFRIEISTSRDQALVWAARKGHVSLVQHLLNRQASIEHKDRDGWNSLHWAAFTANLDLFNLLLSRGADYCATTKLGGSMLHLVSSFGVDHVRSEADDYIGSPLDRITISLELVYLGLTLGILNVDKETPLICAAKYGFEDMISVLVSEGADLTSRDRFDCTPLMRAAEYRHMGVVKILIERQKEVTQFGPGWCLKESAYRGMESAVRVLLDANVTGSDTDWALVCAAQCGHDNIVRLLLDKGANIDFPTHGNYTALMAAATDGHENVVRLLLDKGANVNSAGSTDGTALMSVAFKGHSNIVRLLLDKGANVDATDSSGNTALMEAAWNGHNNIIRLLLDKGANIETKNFYGKTALTQALDLSPSQDPQVETVRLLIDRGANVGVTATTGWSVLHQAVWRGNIRAVDLLLRAGANPFALNHDTQSPLDLAFENGFEEGAERIKLELHRKERDG